jgi:ketopantoate reductase
MGSGGVGGVFGARLAKGGADVTFVARGAHLDAMRKNGLRIEGADPVALPNVNVTDDPASAGRVDIILFAVKLGDTESAARGVTFAPDFVEKRMSFADTLPSGMIASMYHDLQSGKPLELPWLNGSVVDLGAASGVPTPLNRAVRDILILHAQGQKAT